MNSEADESPVLSDDNAESLPDGTSRLSFRQLFLFAIDHVSNEPCFANLFNNDDTDFIDKLIHLSEKSQILYLNLFRRSRKLFRSKTFRLPHEINSENIESLFTELTENGFISFDVDCFSDTELLYMLGKNDLVNLAALFKLPVKNSGRRAIINALLRSSRHPSLLNFFTSPRSVNKSRLRALTERSLGPCFSVVKAYADVLSQTLLCFSLTWMKPFAFTGTISLKTVLCNHIYEIMRMRSGAVSFPAYAICRKSIILRNREELSKLFELWNFRQQLDCLTMRSKFAQAYEHFQKDLDLLRTVIENPTFHRGDLPRFLQRFALSGLAVRLVRVGVEICERLRKYHEAVKLILIVLSSDLLTITSCRTVYFFVKRLLLDQGTHCSDPVACLKKVESLLPILRGLHPGHRLEIQRQIGRLIGEKSDNELSHFWRGKNESSRSSKREGDSSLKEEIVADIPLDNMRELKNELLSRLKCASVVNLSAPTSASSMDIGTNRPFYLWMELDKDATGDGLTTSILQVETWALKHYLRNEKFEKGLHAESRIYTTLFVLLFYDLLYGVDRPDAFYCMCQPAPLDLFAGDFYMSYRDLVEGRLEMISAAKRSSQTPETESVVTDPVSQLLIYTWTEHKDEQCIGIGWNLFPDGESDIVELFWCLGPQLVASICRLLISDYANWSSGLPDLTLWSPSSGKAKLVEVKGPGDQLSSQQMVWIDKLLYFGADVEICSVAAVPRNRYQHNQ
ncbi:fanconi associated nuclease 1 [Echinococcus multilocularis]|uniref:Fanconi-associated nuclease n=1 Tax=Echinococcus multilocularis TaxID=6211 RepID=A0A087W0F8_ECHMU|nr:fanconi associated nuclease 1 [Echinococcus multilocularis]